MEIEKLFKIKDINVLVFGDYMVDKYIIGDVSRISPEAPVPVIEVKSKIQKLGGAGNVVNNLISLGAKVRTLGCIGNDLAGEFLIENFKSNNIDISYFKKYNLINTIIKTRVVSKNQQFLRIDEETKEPLLIDYLNFIKLNKDKIFEDIDVLIISDYAKGAVTKEVTELLISKAREKSIPIIVDPKGNNYSKYSGATICTPNVKELSDVIGKKIELETDIQKYGYELCKSIDLKYLVLTRSEKGISLINRENIKHDFPAIVKEVVDVSGAGDTVVAIIALTFALNYEIDEICKISNLAASVVISKFGTSTLSLNELICSINSKEKHKYQSLETLKYIVKDLKEKGKKIVFTNGCFDMLHVGHLSSFKKAKEFGDVLIVAINSDASVKENKGDQRPIISQVDRIEMICSLNCVDYVILMEDKNPSNLIKTLQPDISVKGEDWKNKEIPEKNILENYGGEIKFIELEKGKSTTNIINKVLEVYKNE